RRSCGRFTLKAIEALLPTGTEFSTHPPSHEGPAHGRSIGLKLTQLLRILARQGIGNGGKNLRGVHQRPLEATESRLQRGGMSPAIDPASENPSSRQLGRKQPNLTSYLGVASQAPAEARALIMKDLGVVVEIIHALSEWLCAVANPRPFTAES